MPVISSRGQTGITQSVGTANVRGTEGSATATALANIGAQGAALADRYLLKQKEDQAQEYATSWDTDKSVKASKNLGIWSDHMFLSSGKDEAGNDMLRGQVWEENDQGQKVTTGKTLDQKMKDWDAAESKKIEDGAPTDLARRAFTTTNNPASKRNLLAAETMKTKLLDGNFRTEEDSNTRKAKLRIEGNSGFVQATGDMTLDELNRMENGENAGVIKGRQNELQAKQNRLKNGAKLVRAGADNLLKREKISELFGMIGTDSFLLKEENKEFIKNDLRDDVRHKMGERGEITDIKIIKPGVLQAKFVGEDTISDIQFSFKGDEQFRVLKKESKKEGQVVFEKEKGSEVRADQQIQSKGLLVKGTFKKPENKFLEYLSAADQRKYLGAGLKQLMNKSTKNNKRLKTEVKSMADMYKEGKNLPDFSNENNESTLALREKLRQIEESDLDPVVKDTMAVGLAASSIAGSIKNGLTWSGAGAMKGALDNIDSTIDKRLTEMGEKELAEDPLFSQSVKIQTKKMLANEMSRVVSARNKPAEYIKANDPVAVRLGESALNSPEEYKEYKEHMDMRNKQIGTPQEFETVFSENDLNNMSLTLTESLKPERGGEGKKAAGEWLGKMQQVMGEDFDDMIGQMREKGKFSDEILLLSSFDLTSTGIGEVMDNIQNSDEIRERYKKRRNASKDEDGETDMATIDQVEAAVFRKMDDLGRKELEVNNTMDGTFKLNAAVDVVTSQFLKTSNLGKVKSLDIQAQIAFDQTLGANLVKSKEGSDTIGVGLGVLKRNDTTAEQLKAIHTTFNNPSFKIDEVDLRGTFSQTFIDRAIEQDIKPENIDKFLKTTFMDSKIIAYEKDGYMYRLIKDPTTNKSTPIKSNVTGQAQRWKLKVAKDFDEVSETLNSASFNFFGQGDPGQFIQREIKEKGQKVIDTFRIPQSVEGTSGK